MKKYAADLYRGIIKENPTFVLFLGLCPTLALTNNLSNAIGMGASVVVVLAITNSIISMIRKVIPGDIRIPVFITVIASVVTVLSMVMEAFLPALFESLGIYLPLIVVNCIILGRAESFASENGVMDSFVDGIASGLGFLVGLSILGFARELIGTGQVELLKFRLIDDNHAPVIFVESSGAFLMFGLIAWAINTDKVNKEQAAKAKEREAKKAKAEKIKKAKEAAAAKKAAAEAKEASSEAKEVSSEAKEVSSEAKEVSSEAKEVSSEAKEVSSEAKEVSSEAKEVSSEAKEVSSEAKEVSSETKEVSSETKEVSSEAKEVSSETKEVSSETKEVSSETKDANTEDIKTDKTDSDTKGKNNG